ncbi:MAG: methylenetetrahydrofolate reductase [Alphaproteobacteria bacterium]|nr:methylenetetrahydrofolate reductase [Alphaproteobacteria bacterium]MDE2013193.1 methylenetetrahydrofolate reductase [Alphaproteobacteria bacterium]MDE2073157.1 methylenetetrahydrofolate reductase [Alphaproteobacteria bacterium]
MNQMTVEKPAAHTALAALLKNYSAEVTTHDRASLDAAGALLPRGTEVFIAALMKDDPDRHVAAAMKVRQGGLEPVPHIVARNLRSKADLDSLLARLAGEAGVERALVLGGDRDKAAGEFESSLQLIETGLFQKHGIKRIAIGCYPEGHPRIPGAALDEARAAKLRAAEQAGLDVLLVSQFCFDAQPILSLARHMRALGCNAPFRVGVAGPADRATLVKYAVICGVGASLRALKERQNLAKNMLSGETPEGVLSKVAAAQNDEPSLGISSVHFFTFGALANTIKWVENCTRDARE